MFKMEWTVKKAKWLQDPNLRWRAGLEEAGLQFRQRIQRQNYPPPPPFSRYVRTGLLADKAGFRIYMVAGKATMFFGSTYYLPKLLYDTPNWSGKKDEILEYMQAGFKKGVQDYRE